jgi:16S rRNA (cytosine1402-N4)-methyltransferase
MESVNMLADESKLTDNNTGKPKRRVRYSGTHPKAFAQKYKEHAIDAHPELLEHFRAKGKTPAGTHIPVLTDTIMTTLAPQPGEIVADCTLGYGGHAALFLEKIGPSGKLIGLDVDGPQLERTRERLSKVIVPMSFHHCNFAGLGEVMQKEGLEGFDVIFADLGVSSMQIDDPSRGISYKHDGPLDMRMDNRRKQTAAELLAAIEEKELSEALWGLSDEPYHKAIAQRITEQRQIRPLASVAELAELVLSVKGLTPKEWKRQIRATPGLLHPAARTFQALRMLVNDELGALKTLLRIAPYCLRTGGRMGIISFHSGEDRLVKKAFAQGRNEGLYVETAQDVIVPDHKEIDANPRSRSAKFRWAKRSALL